MSKGRPGSKKVERPGLLGGESDEMKQAFDLFNINNKGINRKELKAIE